MLIQCFEQYRNGDKLTTDDFVRYVNRYLKPKADPGNVKRELRFLRAEGLLNYRSVGERREKIIEVIR